MQLWHAIVCLLAGVVLASSVLGPDISSVLSQLSGGISTERKQNR